MNSCLLIFAAENINICAAELAGLWLKQTPPQVVLVDHLFRSIGAQTCQGTSRTCQNFFTFTFKAAGVTFLKVILHLLQKVLNRR